MAYEYCIKVYVNKSKPIFWVPLQLKSSVFREDAVKYRVHTYVNEYLGFVICHWLKYLERMKSSLAAFDLERVWMENNYNYPRSHLSNDIKY